MALIFVVGVLIGFFLTAGVLACVSPIGGILTLIFLMSRGFIGVLFGAEVLA